MKKLLATLFLVLAAHSWAHDSHCSKAEKTLFSCLAGKKIVSICASQDLSPNTGYMQYRYGKVGNIEIKLPRLDQHPLAHVDADAYQAASGENGSVTFSNSNYTYTVYWESYRSDSSNPNGSSHWVENAGLRASNMKGLIFDHKCAQPTAGDVRAIDPSYLHDQVGFKEQ